MSFHPNYLGGGFSASFTDLTVTGNLTFGDVATDILDVSGYITGATGATASLDIIPDTGKYLRIGDVAASTHSFNTNDDLLVTGRLEIDGQTYFDGAQIQKAGTIFSSDVAGQTGGILMNNSFQTPDTMNLTTGTLANSILICEHADYGFDFAHAQATDPTLFIHSHNQATDEWVSLAHDGTNGQIGSGKGGVKMRKTARVTTITTNANPTVNTDDCDAVTITAQAGDIASMTTNLSGTPTNFQQLTYRIKDNGTARAIAWGASFTPMGVALPTTTVISKILTVGFLYDTVLSKWACIASVQEA